MTAYANQRRVAVAERALNFTRIQSSAPLRRAFGAACKLARESLGIGEAEMAELLECDIDRLADLESGERGSIERMRLAVDVLGLEAEEVLL